MTRSPGPARAHWQPESPPGGQPLGRCWPAAVGPSSYVVVTTILQGVDELFPKRSFFKSCSGVLKFRPGVHKARGGNISKIGLWLLRRSGFAAVSARQLDESGPFRPVSRPELQPSMGRAETRREGRRGGPGWAANISKIGLWVFSSTSDTSCHRRTEATLGSESTKFFESDLLRALLGESGSDERRNMGRLGTSSSSLRR